MRQSPVASCPAVSVAPQPEAQLKAKQVSVLLPPVKVAADELAPGLKTPCLLPGGALVGRKRPAEAPVEQYPIKCQEPACRREAGAEDVADDAESCQSHIPGSPTSQKLQPQLPPTPKAPAASVRAPLRRSLFIAVPEVNTDSWLCKLELQVAERRLKAGQAAAGTGATPTPPAICRAAAHQPAGLPPPAFASLSLLMPAPRQCSAAGVCSVCGAAAAATQLDCSCQTAANDLAVLAPKLALQSVLSPALLA